MVLDQSLRLPEPVVILGGGGFIGSNLGKFLHDLGYDIGLVDVEFQPWRWPLCDTTSYDSESLVLIESDLRDYEAVFQAVAGAGTVFHLAADMGGVEYFHSDKDFAASMDNGIITANVVKACASNGVERLIYTSSACAADTSNQMTEGKPYAITEHDITYGEPDARYGAEKRYGAYLVSHAPLDGRVAVLHTVYGPGQEFEGQRRKFPSAVCTNALAAVKENKPLVLFGNGNQLRSYLYIDDAIDMIYTLAVVPREAVGDGIFQIGSEYVYSCTTVAETVLDILGDEDHEILYNHSKPSGVLARTANMGKWQWRFGWPTDRPLEEGFKEFIDWLRTQV